MACRSGVGGSVGGSDEETECTRLLLFRSEGSEGRRSKEPLRSLPLPVPAPVSVRVAVVVPVAAVVLVSALVGGAYGVG